MNNSKSKSVAIIGGGVIGMSTAFHLAEKGVSKIIVIDKGNIGGGSSLQAAGIVTSLEWNETAIRARLKTLDNFERFSRILNGYSFHQVGCVNLSSEEVRLPLVKITEETKNTVRSAMAYANLI